MSGQAWATYLPAERVPSDGSKPRGATVFARDFQTVVIYDAQGKFVGVRRPGSNLPIQVGFHCQVPESVTNILLTIWNFKFHRTDVYGIPSNIASAH